MVCKCSFVCDDKNFTEFLTVISWKSLSIKSHSGAGAYVQGKQALKKEEKRQSGTEKNYFTATSVTKKKVDYHSLIRKKKAV